MKKLLCPASSFCLEPPKEELQETRDEIGSVNSAWSCVCGVLLQLHAFSSRCLFTTHVSGIKQRCSSNGNFPHVSWVFSCLPWQEVCESVAYRRLIFV